MKKKLLVLTNNPVAKIGIASYLSSIFNQYLTIQAARGADATLSSWKVPTASFSPRRT